VAIRTVYGAGYQFVLADVSSPAGGEGAVA